MVGFMKFKKMAGSKSIIQFRAVCYLWENNEKIANLKLCSNSASLSLVISINPILYGIDTSI